MRKKTKSECERESLDGAGPCVSEISLRNVTIAKCKTPSRNCLGVRGMVDGGKERKDTRSERKTRSALLYCKWALKKKEAIQLIIRYQLQQQQDHIHMVDKTWQHRESPIESRNERSSPFDLAAGR